jgi:excisionase family DNA binding protein
MKPLTEYPDILTVGEMAELLRVSKITVYHLIKAGQIAAFKIGRQYKCPKLFIVKQYFSL